MAEYNKSVDNLRPVHGISLASAIAGIYKTKRNDVTLIRLEKGSVVTAAFTSNRFAAAPVIVARKHLNSNISPEFLLINSGNANAGMGKQGQVDAVDTCESISRITGCKTEAVLPFSTGVIGERLPVEKINQVLPHLVENQDEHGWLESAGTIMTTDTVVKAISSEIEIDGYPVVITGIAKGSGMIRPNMATMLAFIATDAAIYKSVLISLQSEVIERTFNRITVDGDTSTNDACVMMATGMAGNAVITDTTAKNYKKLRTEFHKVCLYLAKSIVRDGEGATKFITVSVKGGASSRDCLNVAYAISHSPLVKTALYASDPNWGRILSAIGNADLENPDVSKVSIFINESCIVKNGSRHEEYTEQQGLSAMAGAEINLTVDLGIGTYSETVWTCDLSHDYVSINADYRS